MVQGSGSCPRVPSTLIIAILRVSQSTYLSPADVGARPEGRTYCVAADTAV